MSILFVLFGVIFVLLMHRVSNNTIIAKKQSNCLNKFVQRNGSNRVITYIRSVLGGKNLAKVKWMNANIVISGWGKTLKHGKLKYQHVSAGHWRE